jgi:polyferredoxin
MELHLHGYDVEQEVGPGQKTSLRWWVGLSFFTAFVGNLWPLANPWRVIFDWAEGLARRLGYRDGLDEPYPEALGIWPAVGFYLVFVWIENVFSGSYVPRNIALFALAYTLITLYGMAFFGKETWLRSSWPGT